MHMGMVGKPEVKSLHGRLSWGKTFKRTLNSAGGYGLDSCDQDKDEWLALKHCNETSGSIKLIS
jgi:hypothetical protein